MGTLEVVTEKVKEMFDDGVFNDEISRYIDKVATASVVLDVAMSGESPTAIYDRLRDEYIDQCLNSPEWMMTVVEDFMDEADIEEMCSDPSNGVRLIRDIYMRNPVRTSEVGRRMAQDEEAMQFFTDYWKYVKWNEHGNEASLSEVGFVGFVDAILHPESSQDYLLGDGTEYMTTEAMSLYVRLMELHRRYKEEEP